MIDLKPCPFCGDNATLCAKGLSKFSYQVECDGCYAMTGWSSKDTAVIEAWNTRATPNGKYYIRYCPMCSNIGEIYPPAIQCCPEHRECYIPEEVAEQAKRGFPTWYPIETAPKDGTFVLLTNERDFSVAKYGMLRCGSPAWIVQGTCLEMTPEPTHWMPLPEPPK